MSEKRDLNMFFNDTLVLGYFGGTVFDGQSITLIELFQV